jgi:hypothetical protein
MSRKTCSSAKHGWPQMPRLNGGVRLIVVSRWLLGALGVALVGATIALFVVPYGPHDCPDVQDCHAWGAGPRILTLLVTAVVVVGMLTAAILDSVRDR